MKMTRRGFLASLMAATAITASRFTLAGQSALDVVDEETIDIEVRVPAWLQQQIEAHCGHPVLPGDVLYLEKDGTVTPLKMDDEHPVGYALSEPEPDGTVQLATMPTMVTLDTSLGPVTVPIK